jgi:hypothetical protein
MRVRTLERARELLLVVIVAVLLLAALVHIPAAGALLQP